MTNKRNIISKLLVVLLVFGLMASTNQRVFALSDGAYIVTRKVSYTNPDTGTTADGGSNIALGESMAESIVESQVLVEISGGKTYVTIGLGMMSNVSNIRFTVKQSNGSYKQVTATRTGTSTKDGDSCYHYRFEVPSGSSRISPMLYVTPMGRDVQFYIDLNMSSAKAGTGIYTSEMVATAAPEVTKAPTAAPTTAPEATKAPTTQETATTAPQATTQPTTSTTATEAPASSEAPEQSEEPTATPEPTEEPTLEEKIEASEGIVLNTVEQPEELIIERGMTVENAVAILICMLSFMGIQGILIKRGRK